MTTQDTAGVLYRAFLLWRSRLYAKWNALRYWRPEGYDARQYWGNRLKAFGPDNLRGVGFKYQSHEENRQTYEAAAEVFLSMCAAQDTTFPNSDILEVGCGTGFYTQICQAQGTTRYQGVDITDVLFDELREKFPGYAFTKLDITANKLEGSYDLIIMIDVTQHITSSRQFSFAMQNLRHHVKKGGCIVLTFWPSDKKIKNFYEAARPLDAYLREFPGFTCSEPVAFRDKYIVSLRAPL